MNAISNLQSYKTDFDAFSSHFAQHINDASSVIRDLILHTGPISVEKFIDISSFYQNGGYYSQNIEIGSHGDFITAPTITSIFGEIIALYICDRILAHNMKSVTLVECGAGNGTMLHDIITTLKKFQSINAMKIISKIIIIEISEKLRNIQSKMLSQCEMKIEWCSDISDINANNNLIFVANEFLDAIPIKQYVSLDKEWYQRCIGIDNGGNFVFTKSPIIVDISRYIETIGLTNNIQDEDIIEIPSRGLSIFGSICSMIKSNGGSGLFIDYGYDHCHIGSTIQAIRKHQFVDLFSEIGSTDISHMVQFPIFMQVANDYGIKTRLMKQNDFLTEYYINRRIEMVKKIIPDAKSQSIDDAIKRLMSPNAMGQIFHTMMIN